MGMLKSFRAMAGAFLLIIGGAGQALALDGAAIVARNCVSCHDLTGPAPSTFRARLNRIAPDLFYAGSKFKKTWLVGWLQDPTLIRPTGVLFLNHIVIEGGKDRIKVDSVKLCSARLSPAEAVAVADHLMTLKDSTMKTGVVDPAKKFRRSKARTLFTKQLACLGCHKVKIGKRIMGGVSGPDLRHGGSRLNPDWIYALIENPQHWNPMTLMPKSEMSHKKRVLLATLLATMK